MTLRAKRVTGTRQICTFGARVLDRLLDAFTRQLGGVPTADNPDHIHDLRVASRRLRAALPIFRGCFTAQEYRTWMKEIRRITRTLGTARDEDVQIEFLRGKIASCQDSALLPGLEYLLAGLTKERNSAQPAVVRAIDRIHERGTLRDLSSALQGAKRVQGRGVKATGTGTIYAKARDDIRKRLDALIALETSLEDRDAVEGHHAMRIAAKWLRYTMEVYGPLYGGALDGPVSTVKRVQELLGTIHDLDVWIAHLPRVLNDTRDLDLPGDHPNLLYEAIRAGIQGLLEECQNERRMLFEEFGGIWTEYRRAGFVHNLTVLLEAEQYCSLDKSGILKAMSRRAEARIFTLIALARGYRSDEEHSLHVTRLSLSLFDQLGQLHRLCARERYLLRCAGILHDIGCAEGRNDHQQRSFELILSDKDLPFTKKERMVVGLVARYHGWDLPDRSHEDYGALESRDKKRVRVLAALLRIADALDVSHEGRISHIEVRIKVRAVVIRCSGKVPAEEEQSAVERKGNLFEQIFKKNLEITWIPEK